MKTSSLTDTLASLVLGIVKRHAYDPDHRALDKMKPVSSASLKPEFHYERRCAKESVDYLPRPRRTSVSSAMKLANASSPIALRAINAGPEAPV